jgi:hypothetical protein
MRSIINLINMAEIRLTPEQVRQLVHPDRHPCRDLDRLGSPNLLERWQGLSEFTASWFQQQAPKLFSQQLIRTSQTHGTLEQTNPAHTGMAAAFRKASSIEHRELKAAFVAGLLALRQKKE